MTKHSVAVARTPGAPPSPTVVLFKEKGIDHERGEAHPGKVVAIDGERTSYRDRACPGLVLRVSPSGARSWRCEYRYQGRPRRVALGAYTVGSLASARRRAAKMVEQAKDTDRPIDAWATKKREDAVQAIGETVAQVGAKFITARSVPGIKGELAPRTASEYKRVLKALPAKFTRLRVVDVLPGHVSEVVQGIKAHVQSNRTLAVLKSMFSWAKKQSLIEVSPAKDVERLYDETPRERTYSNEELAAIVQGAKGTEIEKLVLILLYTGTRFSEAASAQAEHFADSLWTVPETKQGGAHVVPVSEGLQRVLDTLPSKGYIFPAPTKQGYIDHPHKAVVEVRGAEGVPADFRLHDLRRSCRTGLAVLGVRPDIAALVLGHSLPGVDAKTYDKYSYLPERKSALSLWSAYLDAVLAGGEPGKVLAFQRG